MHYRRVMAIWRHLTRGLRVLTHPQAAERELVDEVEHYLEEAAAALVESGLSPAEARRRARLELGHATAVREQVREYGWEHVIDTLFADARYGVRRLRNSPGFTTVSVLTLALGVGASTAIFSAVNPILFEALPYPHADRILMIWDIFQGERNAVTFHNYREVAERSRSFKVMAVMESWQPAMTGPAQPERFEGQSVSANYFRVLGVAPVLGRDFRASDDRFHGPHVVILSDGLWRQRFGGDRTIIGHPITLDGDSYEVIGIMPRGFESVLAPSAEMWSTLQYDTSHIADQDTKEWGHHLRMIGRLRPGIDKDAARRELNVIAHAPVAEFPRPRWASLDQGFIANAMQDEVTRDIKPALLAVSGAVLLLLLIACVNVTNLLLARGAQRRGEFAMRAALGAGRMQMIRQLLTETMLLALVGGVCGMAVAGLGVRALMVLSPPELPRLSAIHIDGAVFAFAFAVTTLAGLAVGLIPPLAASRDDLHAGLQQSSRRTAGGHQATRRILVVAEVALALMLLVSAGLLLRSLERLFGVPPGFDSAHLLTMQVQTSGHRFDRGEARQRFFMAARDEVRRMPGVTAAAFTSLLPLSGYQLGVYGANFEDKRSYDVYRYVVTPGYCEAMRIPLLRGRLLNEHDVAGALPVVLISQSLARREFGDEDPIGKRVHVGPLDRPWYIVAGVVGDVKQMSLEINEPDAVYLTAAQSWFADEVMSLVVRTRDDAASHVSAIKKAIWSVDKDQPIVQVAMMDQLLATSVAQRRFALSLFEAFALVALVLAATGIYGVLSGSVTERMREIGVRAALGASRGNILALVVRQGLTLTGMGVVLGLVGAAIATEALVTLLFGVSRLDPVTYAGVIALLAAVGLIACWLPAWRAARVDPAITLRAE
ncbi:MAG TPA: ABC transporter permease [Bryobacteraceae bacterium]|nr:ABC transporter permease [Bryobacteraceae bacterium]